MTDTGDGPAEVRRPDAAPEVAGEQHDSPHGSKEWVRVVLPSALTGSFAGSIPFPATFRHRSTERVAQVYVTGLTSAAALSLGCLSCPALYLVTNLATSEYVVTPEGDLGERSLVELLGDVDADPLHIEDDVVALRTEDLVALLCNFEQYNLRAISLDDPSTDVVDLWASVESFRFGDDALLLESMPATAYLDTHDDIYAYAESTRPDLPHEAASLLLAHVVATEIAPAGATEISVTLPSLEVVNALLAEPAFVIDRRRVRVTPDEVTLWLAHAGWMLGQDLPEPSRAITYRRSTGEWSIGGRP